MINRFRVAVFAVLFVISIYVLNCATLLIEENADLPLKVHLGPVEHFNPSQLLMLGWVTQRRTCQTSYLHHPMSKPKGIVRIGVFGGSHTLCGGSNQNGSYDYPTLLQNRFRSAGKNQIEVINFGSEGYGFFQQYMLWDFLGKKYDLDYVVVGLNTTPQGRDRTFFPHSTPFLHARYVLKNQKDLVQIPVVGSTRTEALRIYRSVFPPWRYLLYDANMPTFIKALLPKVLHRKENPFYYSGSSLPQHELAPIYAALLDHMSKEASRLIVLASEEDAAAIQSHMTTTHIYFYSPQAERRLGSFIFYERATTHPNQLGNQQIADELFSLFSGDLKPHWTSVRIFPCAPGKQYAPSSVPDRPLSQYRSLFLGYGSRRIATLKPARRENGQRHEKTEWSPEAGGLLMFDRWNPILVLLKSPPQDGEEIVVEYHENGRMKKASVGNLVSCGSLFGVVRMDSNRFWIKRIEGNQIGLEVSDAQLRKSMAQSSEVYLCLGHEKLFFKPSDSVAGRLYRRLRFWMRGIPIRSDIRFLSCRPNLVSMEKDKNFFTDGSSLEEGQTLDLVLEDPDGRENKIPIFIGRKVEEEAGPVHHQHLFTLIESTGRSSTS